ncbi:MAG TPA: HAD family phosphatase [Stellaceae bacterium]|jgi:2-haloacid dehalogenase|nr:HAD family phosphatase [Stellaceae bacterium]
MQRTTVIFDFGGVLIDWNPRHLYRKLFAGDDAAMEDFLATVCNPAWNIRQDGGRPVAEATSELTAAYPHHAELIAAFYGRFDEMMPGPIEGTVAILGELRDRGVPVYGLTNFSAETYPLALARFPFIGWLRGVVVSGEHRIIKPDPAIYRLLCDRFAIDPLSAVFIDDNKLNAEGAEAVGIKGIHFTGPEALRAELVDLGLLPTA